MVSWPIRKSMKRIENLSDVYNLLYVDLPFSGSESRSTIMT